MESKIAKFRKWRKENGINNCLICNKNMQHQKHHLMCDTCHQIDWDSPYWSRNIISPQVVSNWFKKLEAGDDENIIILRLTKIEKV